MKVKVKKYTGVYGGYKIKKAEYEEPNFYHTLENPNSFKNLYGNTLNIFILTIQNP